MGAEMSSSSPPAALTVTTAFNTPCSNTPEPISSSHEGSKYFMPQNLSQVSVVCSVDGTNMADEVHIQMLGSNSVPNLGPQNQSHVSGSLQEQLLMPIQESIEPLPAPMCINEAHMHWGIEKEPTISNNSQPCSPSVMTRRATEVDIKEGHLITQRRDFNILVEPQPANNLLPIERFRLCHPRDSATPYDIIHSRSMFGDVTAILSEIDALL